MRRKMLVGTFSGVALFESVAWQPRRYEENECGKGDRNQRMTQAVSRAYIVFGLTIRRSVKNEQAERQNIRLILVEPGWEVFTCFWFLHADILNNNEFFCHMIHGNQWLAPAFKWQAAFILAACAQTLR